MTIIRNVIRNGIIRPVIRSVVKGPLLTTYINRPLLSSLLIGSGHPLSFARNSTETIIDYEGVSQTIIMQEAGFNGSRRVYNEAGDSVDLDGATWTTTLNGTATAIFGPGNNSVTLGCPVIGDRAYLFMSFATVAGRQYRISFDQTVDSGLVSGGSVLMTGGQDSNGLVTIVGSGRCQSEILTDATGTAGSVRIGIGASSGVTSPGTITISNPQIEDITGSSNINSSEYVPTTDQGANINGVKYFETTKNVSAVNNIVTILPGTPLTTMDGILLTANSLLDYLSTPSPDNDFQVSLDFTANQANATIYLWSSYVDSSNYIGILHNGVNVIARQRLAGVNSDANITLPAFVVGQKYNIKATYSSVTGIDIELDGVPGTGQPTQTGGRPLGSTIQVGSLNGANDALGMIKNLTVVQI